jgi:hypothetical protein
VNAVDGGPAVAVEGLSNRIVVHRELLRFYYDRTRMVSQLIQPVPYLLVMGTGLGLPGGRRRQREPENLHLPGS